MTASSDRFRTAARAYFIYGVVYWIGGVYLTLHDVGRGAFAWVWIMLGLVLVFLVPFLLRRPRPWFEQWLLHRRDFARIIALLMAYRALVVLRVAYRPVSATVPAPWDGDITFRAGAAVFFIVTVTALVFVARAAWQREAPA